MKNYILIVLVFLSLMSCISIKNVDDINRYEIVAPKKDKSSNPNMFVFQINRDRNYFLNYLRDRYSHIKGFTPKNFTAVVKDVEFYVSVLSEEDSSTYVDLSDLIFNKDNPEFVKNGKTKRFISITITDINGVDALSNNSFYRNIVVDYLDGLRTGFKAY